MGTLGNILWIIFGGLISAILWLLAGFFWCITIIGIPLGIQCFKFSKLTLAPFGRDVDYGGGVGSLILNILWIVITGVPMAIVSAVIGCILCITVIGIPFGLQHFKIAKLALMPFGTRVA